MTKTLLLFGVLLMCGVAWADDFVCGDETKMTRYIASVDPSKVTEPTCFQIPEAETEAQRDLVRSTPQYYLKVVEGLAVEKTQTEKDVVDAAKAAQQAAQQTMVDETATNDFCSSVSLQMVDQRVDAVSASIKTDIDAVSNIATAKTALTKMNNTYSQAFKLITRCLTARRFVR